MKKTFISFGAFLLTVILLFVGALSTGNPYVIPGAKTHTGAAPRGSLVLDNQTELPNRNDKAYEPEKKSPIDLKNYKLVFNEEFEGSELDESVWQVTHLEGVPDRAGIRTSKYRRISDGKLYMPIKLVDYEYNGKIIKTWTLDSLALRKNYSYGYYECRAIMPKAHNGNGAFWLQSPNAYVDGVAPKGGVEVDIIESQCYGGSYLGSYNNDPQVYEINIHYNSEENRKKLRAHGIKVPGGDMYEEFHTYGLLWTPKYYVFYVDRMPAYKTTFGIAGPEAEEYVQLSLDLRGSNFQAAPDAFVENNDTSFIVDYVKIWQMDNPDDYPDFDSGKFINAFNNIIIRIYNYFDRVADFFRALFKI